MLNYAYGWLASAGAFLVLDAIWLSQMATRFYRPAIGDLLADKPRLGAAAVFYVLYVSCTLVLAVLPALKEGGLSRAAMLGAIVGLLAYGTYDLTNHATLKVWPIRLTLVDMTWGTLLTCIAATVGYLVMRATQS